MASVSLFNSSFIGSSAGQSVGWIGGRGSLVLSAESYGGGVYLQLQNINGHWISVNASPFNADQVTAYDLPAGQYRMISNASSSINVSATLVSIPYMG